MEPELSELIGLAAGPGNKFIQALGRAAGGPGVARSGSAGTRQIRSVSSSSRQPCAAAAFSAMLAWRGQIASWMKKTGMLLPTRSQLPSRV
jgi:hypothetical protein